MSATHQQHPYHLVEPSPWPVVGAGAALTLFGGLVMFLHEVTVFGIAWGDRKSVV